MEVKGKRLWVIFHTARVATPRLSIDTSLIKEEFDNIMSYKGFNRNRGEYVKTVNYVLSNLIYNKYNFGVATIIPATDTYKCDYGITGSRVKSVLNRLMDMGYINSVKGKDYSFHYHTVYWLDPACPIINLINSDNYEELISWCTDFGQLAGTNLV